MKKIFFAIAFVLVSLLIGFTLFIYQTDALSFNTVELKEIQTFNEEYQSITVTSDVDVAILPTKQNQYSVELSGRVSERLKDTYSLIKEEEKDTLKIEVKRKKMFFQIWSVNQKTNLKIFVPEKQFDKINIETTSGDIDIQSLQANSIDIRTTSGDVSSKRTSVLRVLQIQTNSGDISALEDKWKSLKAISTSGDVLVKINKSLKSVEVNYQGSSGKVKDKSAGFTFSEKSEHRLIGVRGGGTNQLKVETTSGDFTFE